MTLSITVPDDDDGWQWQLIKYAQIDSLAEENMSTETAVIMSSSSASSTTISETNECNWGALLLTAVVTGGVVGNAVFVRDALVAAAAIRSTQLAARTLTRVAAIPFVLQLTVVVWLFA